MYYVFSNNTTVLLTCDNNIRNYTTLPFQFENEQLYHFVFNLYKKVYLKKLNYEFQKTEQFEIIKKEFLTFAKKDWIYEITYDEIGKILEKYYEEEQILHTTFNKLKQKYDLLYKDYEISKNKKSNKWVIALMTILILINLICIGLVVNN